MSVHERVRACMSVHERVRACVIVGERVRSWVSVCGMLTCTNELRTRTSNGYALAWHGIVAGPDRFVCVPLFGLGYLCIPHAGVIVP